MNNIRFLLTIFAVAAVAACSDSSTADEKNTAPTCKITTPIEGQVCDGSQPLSIKGRISDMENNIIAISLTIGDKVVREPLTMPFFEYTVAPDDLSKGTLAISLAVKDEGGLTAEHTVNIRIEKDIQLMTAADGTDHIAFSYWTEECDLRVNTPQKWTITFPSTISLEVYDPATGIYEKKSTLSGQGETVIRLRAVANDLFSDRTAELKIVADNDTGRLTLTQKASPDMIELLEDENLRIAACTSIIIFDMDPNSDGKISAFEAEIKPKDNVDWGFTAPDYDIVTTRGIENFPHLRHLDINGNSKLTEIDLSGNRELMSIHVHNCPNLKSLDLSQTPLLIELGCDYDLYLSSQTLIGNLKNQMHTLGIFNRKPGQPSVLDFTGFTNLQRLYVNDNGLTELKLNGCTRLWRLVAHGNAFEEIDLSEVDRYPENMYYMDNNPALKRIYVWKGFTPDYYYMFIYDEANGVEIIEK